jgi:hypothetical protein
MLDLGDGESALHASYELGNIQAGTRISQFGYTPLREEFPCAHREGRRGIDRFAAQHFFH